METKKSTQGTPSKPTRRVIVELLILADDNAADYEVASQIYNLVVKAQSKPSSNLHWKACAFSYRPDVP